MRRGIGRFEASIDRISSDARLEASHPPSCHYIVAAEHNPPPSTTSQAAWTPSKASLDISPAPRYSSFFAISTFTVQAHVPFRQSSRGAWSSSHHHRSLSHVNTSDGDPSSIASRRHAIAPWPSKWPSASGYGTAAATTATATVAGGSAASGDE